MTMSRVSAAVTMMSAILVLLLGFLPLILLESRAHGFLGQGPRWPGLSMMAFLFVMVTPFVLIGLFVHQRRQLGAGPRSDSSFPRSRCWRIWASNSIWSSSGK